MPTVTDRPVTAYAHCPRPGCGGANQVPVDAVERVASFSYMELGGDIPGTERSTHQYVFADDADSACPICQSLREISPTPRRQYDHLTPGEALDPNALLGLKYGVGDVPAPAQSDADARIAALEAKLAALTGDED